MQRATAHAEQLPEELIKQMTLKLRDLKLHQADRFLVGITAYLSEPKQQAYFDAPIKPLNPRGFTKALGLRKLVPNPQTRILSLGKEVFCNGENMTRAQSKDIVRAWQNLSAKKQLFKPKLEAVTKTSLYEAYLSGWLVFEA